MSALSLLLCRTSLQRKALLFAFNGHQAFGPLDPFPAQSEVVTAHRRSTGVCLVAFVAV